MDSSSKYTVTGLPVKLAYGDKIKITVSPAPYSAVLFFWALNDNGSKRAIIAMDGLPKADPKQPKDTLTFNIPANVPAKEQLIKHRYKPGKYLIDFSVSDKDSTAFRREYQIELS